MKSPVKILVIDDDEDDFIIIQDYIKQIPEQEFIIDCCGIYKDAAQKICKGEYDIYFIDYLLGAKTGLDLIEETVQNGCEEPMILLTGNGNRNIDVQAMKSGAVDYLVKTDLSAEKLERCIRYALERTAALKLIKSSERKFRNIFERNKDTVFIAAEDLLLTEVNDASYDLLEYNRSELLSKSLYEFIADKEDAARIHTRLKEYGIVSDKEIEIVTKSGENKNCIITLSRETDVEKGVYIQGIIHEITSLKKAEKATLALEKLKMASRLMRILAHEVRNPLNNILLSTEELRAGHQNGQLEIYLDIIRRNSERISSLITELLNSSGPSEIIKEKKSLQSILDDSITAAADRISLRKAQLCRNYIREDAWIMADHEKLKIAFLNIIINATEAIEEDTGKLWISLKNENSTGYQVCIEDNGCGIKKEDLVKLFEPYFTTKKNGIGLGLASALNILQSHNAFIDVDSKIKKGTSFKLFFSKA